MIRRPDFLFDLLPAIYRQRDLDRGSPLRALFAVLQDQYDLLETDIDALYKDWFVETCEPWVLPYIGELVAAGRLARRLHPGIDTRSLVANTLAYRRRKGLAATLEQVVEQATGWPARVIEPSPLIAMTPTASMPSDRVGRTVDVRDASALIHLSDAFDASCRLATVRPDGLRNLDRLGITLWRLQSYPLYQVSAAALARHKDRRTFHPLGLDMPLFNRRISLRDDQERTERRNLPIPLRRDVVALELAAATAGAPDGADFLAAPAFSITIQGKADAGPAGPVAASGLVIADLSHWRRPAAGTARVAVDPERGRFMLLDPADHDATVTTDHCYGFADDIGGGCYTRPVAPTPADREHRRAWLDAVWSSAPDESVPFDFQAQLDLWRQQEFDGILEIPDSRTYVNRGKTGKRSTEWRVDLRGLDGKNLVIRAARNQRPCLAHGLRVITDAKGGTLVLDGLLIGGPLKIDGDVAVVVRHCTIAASDDAVALSAEADADEPATIHVIIEASIVGPIRLPAEGARLEVRDSIIDGGSTAAISGDKGPGPQVTIEAATVNGPVRVRRLAASDAIFLDPLDVAEYHEGYIRHSHVPAGSRAPACFHCLPIQGSTGAAVPPRFVSERLGQPGYFYFSPGNPREILTGASNGMAMGAFRSLGDAIRTDNYADALTEYLPYGLQVLTIYGS